LKVDSSLNLNGLNTLPQLRGDELVNAHMQAAFTLAWQAYSGKLTKPLKLRRNQPDDNVRVNPCRLIANKGVAFLFGKDISFQLDGDENETSPTEEWLDEVWKANHKMAFLQKVAINGAIYGQAFIQLLPNKPFPRLVNLDPTTVEVTTAPDDVERVTQYKIQWKIAADTLYRKLIEPNENGQSWNITEQQKKLGEDNWTQVNATVWPFPWPPIISCQNIWIPNSFWGMPDLNEDLIDLNRSMNFLLSNMSRVLRYHANPRQIASGMGGEQIKQSADETLLIPKDAKIDLLQAKADVLSPGLEYYQRLKEAFFTMAAVPEVATGKVESIGQLSGLALSILYQPLLELTESKRLTYGDMLNELNMRLLELGGYGTENNATIVWPELLPRDMVAERQAYQIDMAMGIASAETIADKLGYNYELEMERKANEASEQAEAVQVNAAEEQAETPAGEKLQEPKTDKTGKAMEE